MMSIIFPLMNARRVTLFMCFRATGADAAVIIVVEDFCVNPIAASNPFKSLGAVFSISFPLLSFVNFNYYR
jgi:hypothetical protein